MTLIKQSKALVRISLGTALLLLVPLIAMQFTNEVNWDLLDFVVAGGLLFGAGLTFELIAKKGGNFAYRAGVGVAVAASLLLIWISLAVGIIGNEGTPANLMYVGVLSVAVIGALVVRFQPRGMAHVFIATAFVQILVAVIAQISNLGFTFILNGFFATLWVVAALLFRRAARDSEDRRSRT